MGEHGTLIWKSSGKNPELVENINEEKRVNTKNFADNNYDSNDQYVIKLNIS